MQLYNTNTRKLEEFKPLKQDKVKVYFCGPTVYNYVHIGNLRCYTFEDIVCKSLRFLGYNLETTMNITDIDDKTIRDSVASGEKLLDFTQKYTKYFLEDSDKLGLARADNIIPISDVIPEMVRMINTMLKRKNAYISDDGSIYFDVKTFKKYGKLANLDMSGMKAGARIDNDEYDKETAADFVLWKAWKDSDGENYWTEEFIDSEGKNHNLKGRPGWHIECSACNMKAFGPQIDIHMGGIDNIFPHHQNEIAQTESCTRKEFSKYWLHSGHLMVDGKKMSKSLGNFYRLKDLEEKFSDIPNEILYRAIRLSFINGKYRDSIDFSFSKLEAGINTIEKIDGTLKRLDRFIETNTFEFEGIKKEFREKQQEFITRYIEKLEDDFNIPEALAIFFDFQGYINSQIDGSDLTQEEAESLYDMLKTFNEVLGIINFDILDNPESIPENILEKLELRNNAKSEKDFETADNLRDELTSLGYKIIDSKDGSFLEKI